MNANEVTSKKRSIWSKWLLSGIALLLLAAIGGWSWYRYKFPYGHSHACSKGLSMALILYAENHAGWLPQGKQTPEASLSRLAEDDLSSALWVLGGKNVPSEVAQAALTNGVFGPDTCGWHYVEGLREDDDPGIMVAWDKTVGLDHNGMRKAGVEHEIVLLDGSTQFASRTRWQKLVADQKLKLAALIASRESNAPHIRWSDEAALGPNPFPAPHDQ